MGKSECVKTPLSFPSFVFAAANMLTVEHIHLNNLLKKIIFPISTDKRPCFFYVTKHSALTKLHVVDAPHPKNRIPSWAKFVNKLDLILP